MKRKSKTSSSSSSSSSDKEVVIESSIPIPDLLGEYRHKLALKGGVNYVSTHHVNEDRIKGKYTVIVSKENALTHAIPFVCHENSECKRKFLCGEHDKSHEEFPYFSLLSDSTIKQNERDVFECHIKKSDIIRKGGREEGEVLLNELTRLNQLNDSLWANKVPYHLIEEYREKERERKASERVKVNCVVTKTKLEEMNSVEIYTFLSHHVKHQTPAILSIAQLLATTNSGYHPEHRIIKIMICGGSGIGKSETIDSICKLASMEKGSGSPYEKCLIELNFSTCIDKSHGNLLTGSGPGYEACNNESFVDKLISALAVIRAQEKIHQVEETTIREERQTLHKKAQQQHKAIDNFERVKALTSVTQLMRRKKRPNLIIVTINEVDKGTNEMFQVMNTFLEKGILKSNRTDKNVEFILPDDVFLLICSSGNFAESYFNHLSSGGGDEEEGGGDVYSYTDAVNAIKHAMRDKLIPNCDIRRMGHPIPFFPIGYQGTREILQYKLKESIANNGLYLERIKMSMQMSDETQDDFIDYIMKGYYIKEEGIAQIIDRMKDELRFNMTVQTEMINELIDDSIPVPFAERPILSFECLEYRKDMNVISLMKNYRSIEKAYCSIFHSLKIDACIKQKSDIALFVMHHPFFKCVGTHVFAPMEKKTYNDNIGRDVEEEEEQMQESVADEDNEPVDWFRHILTYPQFHAKMSDVIEKLYSRQSTEKGKSHIDDTFHELYNEYTTKNTVQHGSFQRQYANVYGNSVSIKRILFKGMKEVLLSLETSTK